MTAIGTKLAYGNNVTPASVKINVGDNIELHQHGGLLKPEHYLACILQNDKLIAEDGATLTDIADKATSLALACHEAMVKKLKTLNEENSDNDRP